MDSFGDIGVFVRVVEQRSFTRAARRLGLTASGVSRIIARLEAHLGVRLLARTTRSVGLTPDGAVYYERCARILRELEDARGELIGSRGAVRGRLRIDAPTVLGRFVLAPFISRFLDELPELSVDLSVRDHVIDPISEGVDIVLRMAELRESELVHKKLGLVRFLVVGAPSYFAKHGRPSEPAELRDHQTIGFLAGPSPLPWRLRTPTREVQLTPNGRLCSNSPDALREAAVGGHGLAQLLEAHIRDDIAKGLLEVVLSDHEMPEPTVHALYTRDRAGLPKVRAFLDFIATCLASNTREERRNTRKRG